MVLNLGKIQEFNKANDGGPLVLTRLDPVIRLSKREADSEDTTYVFIQHGEFYTEDTKVIPKDRLPPWLDEQIAKLTPEARAECGLQNWKPPEKDDD